MSTQNTDESQRNPQQGLVISYYGNTVAVEAEDGQVFQCQLRRNQPLPVVGDVVNWQVENQHTVRIISICPRRSQLTRADHRGKLKVLAANVDMIVIMMAPKPVFSEYLLDRYLVAVALLKITPLIVLNKMDLLDAEARQAAETALSVYQRLPVAVCFTSLITKEGITTLAQHLEHKTSVLVGPSGVGKSSMIAELAGESIRVGEVTAKGIGKHTTTASTLYHLNSGQIIDSPGVRDFNLWSITEAEVLAGFQEFQNFRQQCRFRDCRHQKEPGCAVQEAVKSGQISEKRLASYQELINKSSTSHY